MKKREAVKRRTLTIGVFTNALPLITPKSRSLTQRRRDAEYAERFEQRNTLNTSPRWVFVVDCFSTDGTQRIVEEWKSAGVCELGSGGATVVKKNAKKSVRG